MDKWKLTESMPAVLNNVKKRESLWTQGNGYMGIRASYEEQYSESDRSTLINGVFDRFNDMPPELAVIPDTAYCDISVNGEFFSMLVGKTEDYNATLDMKTGEITRTLKWTSTCGDEIKLEFFRIVSDVKKHIVAQKIRVTALKGDIKLSFLTGLTGIFKDRNINHFDLPEKKLYNNGVKGLYAKTMQSRVYVCSHYKIKCSVDGKQNDSLDDESIFTKFEISLDCGKSAEFEKITSYATSRDFEYAAGECTDDEVIRDGIKYLDEAFMMGYDGLKSESADSWNKFWNNCCIEVKSNNPFINRAVVFAQYHLHIMASRDDNRLGIGAKAMSGRGYRGHSFWDTEIFVLPYFINNDPSVARRLLEYRYCLLDSAKEKAKKYGYMGAMYPWESAWKDDGEACLEYSPPDPVTGERRKYTMPETEVHITSGIAYAVWMYFCATGDYDFMDKYGNEIIVQTAIFWTSRVTKINNRYEIHGVIGPDEYKEDVNNNAYTNYMAHKNLCIARDILKNCPQNLYDKLSLEYDADEILRRIDDVANNIYLPKEESDGIICQFDGCKQMKPMDISGYKNTGKVFTILQDMDFSEIIKTQVYKQADLVMLFYLMDDLFTDDSIKKNFNYYEQRTLHDSSLSMCIHSLVAAKIGMMDMANRLFFDSCCVDLGENTNNSDNGIHVASIGGIILAITVGFGGLKINSNGIYLSPVLPEGWSEYSFFVSYKGTKINVTVNSDGCKLNKINGDRTIINVNGEQITV